LIALFALIFVRSFAIPESDCITITYVTESASGHAGLSNARSPSDTTCKNNPPINVTRNPIWLPIQPPSRFVTIPKNS